MPRTLFEKIWDQHAIRDNEDGSTLLYLDRVFLHERTGSIALTSLAESERAVRNPAHVFATMDHVVNTLPGRGDSTLMAGGESFIKTMRKTSKAAGISLFDIDDPRHGISHLISAEQGITLPGLIVACPDSHTCTLGALGAIGWGIGTSDCEHALATETLRVLKPRQMRVRFEGQLAPFVSAKDMVLYLIGKYGAYGAAGHALEYCGEAVRELDMEGRFTLCNMAVEFSAVAALIAPDEKTIAYARGRAYSPTGDTWDAAAADWSTLRSDSEAKFDTEMVIDSCKIAPTITWGISPQHAISVDGNVPSLGDIKDAEAADDMRLAMEYMGLEPGQSLIGLPIDGAFIGSCTNSRLSDLRSAASILAGRKVAKGLRAICTPGSQSVKQAAEAEGLDTIFRDAGFEWREPGCSLCFDAGGEGFGDKERVISSTNRNFRGRQGPGTRTHIASPASVAAAAIEGGIADVRKVSNQ